MLERLTAFYESHGISSVDFRCPWRAACSANSPHFTEAKASFVGPRYEAQTLPRLLFLSLDSGSGDPDPVQRTAEAVRMWNLACDVAALPKNRHWYRTHEMAFELLRQFEPQLNVADARLYFAHVNSAKCCQNKLGRKRADSILFENCHRFLPDELRILKPDVVVTQGSQAENAILRSFAVRRHVVRTIASAPRFRRDAHYETGLIEIGPDMMTSLWLQTFHPSNFGHFNPQRAHCWPLYAEEVGRFWRSRRGTRRLPKRGPKGNALMNVLDKRAGIVIGLFRELFECDGQRFGSPSLGVLGVSDGIEGVQWNAWYSQRDETAWLGVNLEGKKYDGWPIARLIEREFSHPRLLTEYRVRVARPEMVTVSWTRDAWQVSSRVRIRESRIAPTPIALDRLDIDGWVRALRCARECLDPKRNYRGRRQTNVTLLRSGQMVERWISPHLQFETRFDESAPHTLEQAKDDLEVLQEFATRHARPFTVGGGSRGRSAPG